MKWLFFLSLVPCCLLLSYGLVAWIRYRFFRKKILKDVDYECPVSIIIACYNEENYIRAKLLSLLDSEEWIEGSKIIVVSGGSTDGTNAILREFAHKKELKILFRDQKLSKIKGINLAIERAVHPVLVFSDCRQSMKKGSIRALIQNFNDPQVGTVASVLRDQGTHKKASILRALINRIVFFDSQSGSGLNLYGALYAQRKSIFKKFPEHQLFEELNVIANTLSQNMRLIQEPEAVIYDVNFFSYYRKERIERLVRGLLLFLTKQTSLIFSINTFDLWRFLTFKYVKLLLPFSVLIWIGLLLIQPWPFFTTGLLLSCTVLLTLFLLNKSARQLIRLCLHVNFYFILAIMGFFFFQRKSNDWQKLKVLHQANESAENGLKSS